MDLSHLSEDHLRKGFKLFNHFMLLLWRLGLGSWGNGTEFGGAVMVIKHVGRRSGLVRHTPVNYAVMDEQIYCTAGFGARSDWFRNILTNPQVEVWLPDGRWAGLAEDVTEMPERVPAFRQVLRASGFAGPLFGVDPRKLTDEDLARLLSDYRLIRIRRVGALTGPGGPGDLAWIWPVATAVLMGLLMRRRRERPRRSA